MARRKLSTLQVDELISRYTQGSPVRPMAIEFGVSEATLLKYMREEGVTIRSPGNTVKEFTLKEKRIILRRYDNGLGDSPDELGKVMSCAGVTVRNFLKREGLYNYEAPAPNLIEFTDEQLIAIVSAHSEGQSSNSLSKEYGCSDSVMLRTLRSNGVDTSGYGRGHRKRLILNRGLWRTCRALSRRMYKDHSGYVNPESLEISRTGYHVDHKLPVAVGLVKGLTVLDLAHPCNLQLLTALENYKKYTKADIKKRELLREIREWNKINGDPFAVVAMELEYTYRYGRYKYFGGSFRTFKGKKRGS